MESDGGSTDDGKRKRSPGEPDIFRRNKKTGRTPDKKHNRDENAAEKKSDGETSKVDKVEDRDESHLEGKLDTEGNKMDKALSLLLDLSQRIINIEVKQDVIIKELKEVKEENEKIKKENEELKTEIDSIKKKLERIEKENKRRNVVVKGMEIEAEETNALKEEMKNFFKQKLGTEVGIKQTRKLGPKMCLVELHKMEDKIAIMKNKNKLRGYDKEIIYINEDMSREERVIQGKLRKIANEERQKGKKVHTRNQQLVIEGEIWQWRQEEENIVKLQVRNKQPDKKTKN